MGKYFKEQNLSLDIFWKNSKMEFLSNILKYSQYN